MVNCFGQLGLWVSFPFVQVIFLVVRVVSSSGSFYHSGECDTGVSLGVSIGGLGSPNDTSGSKRSSCGMTDGGIVLVRPMF